MELVLPIIFFKVVLLQHAENDTRSDACKDLASSC